MSTHDSSISAADPRRSAWVAANAGSGKTYTLANRVTRLLLAQAKPERILCLTYTKAAAAEMQTRLFAQLGKLAMLPDSQLRSELRKICGEIPPKAEWPLARRLFAQALEAPGGLKIQTLHGFCQSVLARFPIEAGIAPGFDVLDEQTSVSLIAEARERVFDRAGTGDAVLGSAIGRLVTETTEMRLTEFLRSCLGTDRRKVERFFQTIGRGEDALMRAILRAHEVGESESELGVASDFAAQVRAELAQLRAAAAWMSAGSTTDRDKGARLARALTVKAPLDAFSALRDALLKKDGDRHKNLVTAGLQKKNPGLHQYLEAFVERICDVEMRRRAARAAELAYSTLLVADAVSGEYAKLKRARGVLDYDDLIVETKKLLEKSEAAQWILYKLDGGIDHILIDEAQDTSPEQWAIVSRLTGEFFAGAGVRGERIVRTIFAVGDEKQSIFSFQGAEPKQFEKYRDIFRDLAVAAGCEFVSEPLETSRRSAPQILDFVDEVFRNPDARDGLTNSELPIRHFAHREKARGRVEFWPAIKPPEEPEPDPQREVDRPSEASAPAQLARKVADQIREWIDHRVQLPDRDRPIRPGDIMILLPRREPFGSLVIRALKDRRIAVSGADRMMLTDEIAVRDLIALGRFALQPEDDLNTATVLRSPFCGLCDKALLSLCYGREGRLWAELLKQQDTRADFARAAAFLTDMLGRADFAPPFEFYSHALTARGMRHALLHRLGTEAEDAIEEFLSLAFSFENSNVPSLESFLDWIERGGAEVKRDMERGRDEVRVMTVHGAKGLEADIVFLPDTTTVPQTSGQKGQLLFDETGVFFPVGKPQLPLVVANVKLAADEAAMREYRRLLYVALTRARDRLYICGFENKRGIAKDSWYRMTEVAAQSLGVAMQRGEETIRVYGDTGDQHMLDIEQAGKKPDLPPWASPAPPEVLRPRLLRPSDAVDGDEPPANSPRGTKGARRFERGLLVHALLSRLPDVPLASRHAIGRRFLASHTVAEDQIEALLAETMAVLDDPAFAPAFAPSSRAEVALTAELPELGAAARINGRVDRLAVGEAEILIVDFKTNRPPPAREEDVAPVYVAQMALYRGAAARIFPGRRIGCALVWTDGPRLMRLSDGVLDAQLREIRTRLDPGGAHS